ncbi:hypothetical protein DFH29DRAFT_1024254 [Suillus ampliporus]|nr:hypothetical protein DFH29DRAFT_1024254 [Suillus ampliporus]
MPNLTLPECGRYIPPPATKEDLEFADLTIIDLSRAQTPEGRAELYPQLRDALRTHGFVYVINHGYNQAQRDRIFDIADVPFAVVPPDEMKTYTGDIEKIGYFVGFKGRQSWKVGTENRILDQIEHYGIDKDVTKRPHPQALRPFLTEVDAFVRHNHFNVAHPILRLIALSLELPEETLVEKHNFDGTGETGDFGSITILWSQPVGGLRIQASDGRWKWVRHIDNALVINTGDMMGFFSGGYYKPTIHRVVQPPEDQRNYDPLGVFYFLMPDDNIRLLPYVESPVLQSIGIQRRCLDEDAPLCATWRKGRTTTYGKSDLKKGMNHNVEEEVIEGIVVKHYN